MTINELKIYLDLSLDSKSKVLDKYARKFSRFYYFFVDSEDGHCYLLDELGNEKDVSLVREINEDMILDDIKKIIIPNGVTSIKYNTFKNCWELTSVTIPNSVISIEYQAFRGCDKLSNVAISNSVTSIGDFAFSSCHSLASMAIPDSVISIGYGAFAWCSGFMDMTIGNNVTSIGFDAFHECNLKSIVFKGKTIDQVKTMLNYPFGIEDESIIKTELS